MQNAYAQLLQTVHQVRDHAKRNIFRIGILINMERLPLSAKVKQFAQEHAEIDIQVIELVGSSEILRQIETKKIDIGFFMPSPNLNISNKTETLTVQKGHVSAVIPQKHPLSLHSQINLHELAQEPLIFPMHAHSLFDALITAFRKNHSEPHIISEMSKISTGIKLAIDHNAIVLEISFFAEAECRRNQYTAVMRPIMPLISRNISIAYLKTSYTSSIDSFLSYILSNTSAASELT